MMSAFLCDPLELTSPLPSLPPSPPRHHPASAPTIHPSIHPSLPPSHTADVHIEHPSDTTVTFDPFPRPPGLAIFPNKSATDNETLTYRPSGPRPALALASEAPPAPTPPPPGPRNVPPFPPPAPIRGFKPDVFVNNETDLATVLSPAEGVQVIGVTAHMVPTGRMRSNQGLFPYIQWSTTIVGLCKGWGGKCTIDAKKQGRIFHITNYNAGKAMKVGVWGRGWVGGLGLRWGRRGGGGWRAPEEGMGR